MKLVRQIADKGAYTYLHINLRFVHTIPRNILVCEGIQRLARCELCLRTKVALETHLLHPKGGLHPSDWQSERSERAAFLVLLPRCSALQQRSRRSAKAKEGCETKEHV